MKDQISPQNIINLYKKIQAIPFGYALPRGPEFLIKKNKGVCSEKHLFLAKELKKLKIPVKFLLIKFDWRDLPIPGEITEKRKNYSDWHMALKAKINNKWIFLDATWNPELKKFGLPVTEDWDGNSDTKLAVNPINIIEIPFFAYKLLEFLIKIRKNKNREFQNTVNEWLARDAGQDNGEEYVGSPERIPQWRDRTG